MKRVICLSLLISFLFCGIIIADDGSDIRGQITAWRDAWQTKDIGAYMTFYAPAFRSGNLDYQGWRSKKSGLFGKPGSITINLYDLDVRIDGELAVARFLQEYSSPTVSDFGEKILGLKKSEGKWRILSERWQKVSKQAAALRMKPISTPPPSFTTPSLAKQETASPIKPYWLNTNSNSLHNASCKWYGNTKKGRYISEPDGMDCGICGGAHRKKTVVSASPKQKAGPKKDAVRKVRYWINSSSNVRHNSGCRYFGNTKRGYFTTDRAGRGCGNCGG